MANDILSLAKQDDEERTRVGAAENLQRRKPMSQRLDAQAAQPPAPAGPPMSTDAWEEQRSQLNQAEGKLDAAASTQLGELNKRTDFAREALESGQLRPEEYADVLNSIHSTAQTYPWKQHMRPPGSNVGDIIEEEGVKKLKTPDGFEPIGYTAEYISKNTVPIGDSGNLAVPTSPREPMKIISRKDWNRDAADERAGINETHKLIQERFEEVRKARLPGKATTDGMGNVTGTEPFTPDELNDMSIEAGEIVSKQYLQARAVYKNIIDGAGGVEKMESAVRGEAVDPFQKEREIKKMEAEKAQLEAQIAQQQQQQQQAPPPTPSMGPPAEGMSPAVQAEWDTLQTTMGGGGSRKQTYEDYARVRGFKKKYDKQEAGKEAEAFSGSGFQEQLMSAAMMDSPLLAATKSEMYKKFKKSPDGTTVELPDGRRYTKDKGKFWQVPDNWRNTKRQSRRYATGSVPYQDLQEPISAEDRQAMEQGQSQMVAPTQGPYPAVDPATGLAQEAPPQGAPPVQGVAPPQPGVDPAQQAPPVAPQAQPGQPQMQAAPGVQPQQALPTEQQQQIAPGTELRRTEPHERSAPPLDKFPTLKAAVDRVKIRVTALTAKGIEKVPVGQAFIGPGGKIFIKVKGGLYGPYKLPRVPGGPPVAQENWAEVGPNPLM